MDRLGEAMHAFLAYDRQELPHHAEPTRLERSWSDGAFRGT